MKTKPSKGFLIGLGALIFVSVTVFVVIGVMDGMPRWKEQARKQKLEDMKSGGRELFKVTVGDKLTFQGDTFEFPDGSQFYYTYTFLMKELETENTMWIFEDADDGGCQIEKFYQGGVLSVKASSDDQLELLIKNLDQYLFEEEEKTRERKYVSQN